MIITATITVEVSGTAWASEYGITPNEVRADVKSYIQTMLQECSPLITLKEVK
jgi:hypothetical protein